jgi:hypothetical protein
VALHSGYWNSNPSGRTADLSSESLKERARFDLVTRFSDRDIASLYYHYTSLKQLKTPPLPLLSKRDKTIAQARLLSWLPRVGELDWNTLVSSHGVEVEHEVGLNEGQGLLHYAALKMVDTEDDMLMHMTLINFFSVLITSVTVTPHLTYVFFNQIYAS